MFNFLEKSVLSWKKPKIIVVAGKEKEKIAETIYQVLKPHFKVGKNSDFLNKEILVLESTLQGVGFALKKSRLPILLINSEEKNLEKMIKELPATGYLILNSDEKEIQGYKKESKAHYLSFGFKEEAIFQAVNVSINSGVNFKLNYKGSVVPIWLKNTKEEEQIYGALAAAAVATILSINLVEISASLRSL